MQERHTKRSCDLRTVYVQQNSRRRLIRSEISIFRTKRYDYPILIRPLPSLSSKNEIPLKPVESLDRK